MATTLLNPLGMVLWLKLLYPQPTTVLAASPTPAVASNASVLPTRVMRGEMHGIRQIRRCEQNRVCI